MNRRDRNEQDQRYRRAYYAHHGHLPHDRDIATNREPDATCTRKQRDVVSAVSHPATEEDDRCDQRRDRSTV